MLLWLIAAYLPELTARSFIIKIEKRLLRLELKYTLSSTKTGLCDILYIPNTYMLTWTIGRVVPDISIAILVSGDLEL